MTAARLFVTVLVAGFLALTATESHAQDQDFAILYRLVPEAGTAAAFDAAIAEHAQWRRDEGDSWIWDLYQVVMGNDLGTYFARSPGHAWADIDAYDAGFGPRGGAHFERTVGPHLADNSNMITRARDEVLRLPEDPGEMRLFWLTVYRVKPGQMSEFWELVGQYHEAIVQADVPIHYSIHGVVAGGSGPEVHLVGLHRNWADFEMPDPNIYQALRDAYGEEEAEEIGRRFADTIESMENMVLRYRPDLSVGR